MITMEFLQIGSQKFLVKNFVIICIEFSVVGSEDDYEYMSNATVTENSEKKYVLYFM